MSSRKKLGSTGESHDDSKKSLGDENGDQTDDDDADQGIYEVERVIDIKHIHDEKSERITKYRVRWKGFGPIDDTWEPLENFTDLCLPVVQEFRQKYQKMKAKVAESSSTSHVNILSEEIDQIINGRTDVSLKQPAVYYLIRWKGYNLSDNTWEHEAELKHAQNMIDTYNRRRKKNLARKTHKHKAAHIDEIEPYDYHRKIKREAKFKENGQKKLKDSSSKIDAYNHQRKKSLAHKINKRIEAAQIIKGTQQLDHERTIKSEENNAKETKNSKYSNSSKERSLNPSDGSDREKRKSKVKKALKQGKSLSEYGSKGSSNKSSKLKGSQKQVHIRSQGNNSSEEQADTLITENLYETGCIDKFLVHAQVHRSSQENSSSEEQPNSSEKKNHYVTGCIEKVAIETEVKEKIEVGAELDTIEDYYLLDLPELTEKIEIEAEVDTIVEYYLLDLPEYNPENVKDEIERQYSTMHHYSKELLLTAIKEDDYQKVFSYLRHKQIDSQDLDYTQMFLQAARYGQRDMALLLAPRVPNLSSEDEWGDTAMCMAARKGDAVFAHYLLVMGVPIQEALARPKELAEKAGNKFFNLFLIQYAKENGTELASMKIFD